MRSTASITVRRSPEDLQHLWESADAGPQHLRDSGAAVRFRPAPGDRGTEIHVELGKAAPGGRVGEVVQGLVTGVPLAKAKDELRRFKQLAETGEIPRSDGSPEGERFARKLKQRPAQPLSERELQEAGR